MHVFFCGQVWLFPRFLAKKENPPFRKFFKRILPLSKKARTASIGARCLLQRNRKKVAKKDLYRNFYPVYAFFFKKRSKKGVSQKAIKKIPS